MDHRSDRGNGGAGGRRYRVGGRPARLTPGLRPAILGLFSALLVAVIGSPPVQAEIAPVVAQGEDDEDRAERERQQFVPLSEEEAQQAITTLQGDARVAQAERSTQRVQVVSVELHEEDKRASAQRRRADVVTYNYDTDETTAAVVTLGSNSRVEQLVVRKGVQARLSEDEVAEAKRLALADPAVQAELRKAGVAGREGELIITHLQVKAVDRNEPCATHRCVLLSFHTRSAPLYINAVVDLTDRRVQLD